MRIHLFVWVLLALSCQTAGLAKGATPVYGRTVHIKSGSGTSVYFAGKRPSNSCKKLSMSVQLKQTKNSHRTGYRTYSVLPTLNSARRGCASSRKTVQEVVAKQTFFIEKGKAVSFSLPDWIEVRTVKNRKTSAY